jgi:hypothetical protein
MSILSIILAHKTIVITAVALAALAMYIIPYNAITDAFAAQGGGGQHQSAAGGHPTNPNAYKVCEHNTTPKKCYGFTADG